MFARPTSVINLSTKHAVLIVRVHYIGALVVMEPWLGHSVGLSYLWVVHLAPASVSELSLVDHWLRCPLMIGAGSVPGRRVPREGRGHMGMWGHPLGRIPMVRWGIGGSSVTVALPTTLRRHVEFNGGHCASRHLSWALAEFTPLGPFQGDLPELVMDHWYVNIQGLNI